MSRKLFLTVTAALMGLQATFVASAKAEVPLTSAEVREITNRVNLIRRGQSATSARIRDLMQPEDQLSTAKRSRAGLRFNDGSFARLGELTLFNFTPGTRNFRLDNGTVLLMIKPGQGRTKIKTPNASAGVRGTALFVRYDQKTQTTIVGALTNNPKGPMEVEDSRGQKQELYAGQMAVITPAGIRLFDFDMMRFYETSRMVRGLDVPTQPSTGRPLEGVPEVRQEMADALKDQKPITGPTVVEASPIIKLSPTTTEFAQPTPTSSTIAQPTGPTTQPENSSGTTKQQPTQPTTTTTPNTNSGTAEPEATVKPRAVQEEKPSGNSNSSTTQPTVTPGDSTTPVVTPITTPVTTPVTTPTTTPVTTPAASPTPVTTPVTTPTPVDTPTPSTTPVTTPTPVDTPTPSTTPVSPTPSTTPVTPNPTTVPVTPSTTTTPIQQLEVDRPVRAIQEQTPTQQTPVAEQTPVQQTPVVEQPPVQQTPVVEQVPVQQTPVVEQVPVQQTPVQQTPVTPETTAPLQQLEATPPARAIQEQTPTQLTPVVEQVPVQQTPTQQTPTVEQTPVVPSPTPNPAPQVNNTNQENLAPALTPTTVPVVEVQPSSP